MGLVTPFSADFWSTKETPRAAAPPRSSDDQARIDADNLSVVAVTDPNNPAYKGPAYSYHVQPDGLYVLDKSSDPGALIAQDAFERDKAAQPTGGATDPGTPGVSVDQGIPDYVRDMMTVPPAPGAAKPPTTRADIGSQLRSGFTNETPAIATPAVMSKPVREPAPWDRSNTTPITNTWGTPAQAPPAAPALPPPPPPAPPEIHRDKIDSILGGLNTYQNDIYQLSKDNTGMSVAEAQLNKANDLAKIRARDELAANQAGAMGAARSSRNRGDVALLSRQAVGEQAYLGSQAQRADTLRQAELEGNLAITRATEADADRKFKLEALQAAGAMGLNTAALEVDIGKADLSAATSYINNQFQQLLANKQIDEQQYEALLDFSKNNINALLGFTRDMAAIQYNYDQLAVQDQQEADKIIMQRYGIDQQTMVALKQIKEAGKFKWDQVLASFAGGVATGATGGLATLAGSGGGAAESTLHDWNNS